MKSRMFTLLALIVILAMALPPVPPMVQHTIVPGNPSMAMAQAPSPTQSTTEGEGTRPSRPVPASDREDPTTRPETGTPSSQTGLSDGCDPNANLLCLGGPCCALLRSALDRPADVLFFDDMESGSYGWSATGFWHQISNAQYKSVYHVGSATPDDPLITQVANMLRVERDKIAAHDRSIVVAVIHKLRTTFKKRRSNTKPQNGRANSHVIGRNRVMIAACLSVHQSGNTSPSRV